MQITCPSASLTAQELTLGDQIAIQHVTLDCTNLTISVPLGSGVATGEVAARIVINERELNRLIGAADDSGIRDLAVALMTGKLRITGRYEVMKLLAVPFALVAVPEIVGDSHIRLDVQDLSVVGATLPGFSSQIIGERLNAKLSEHLNVERLGIPLRLVGISVEPGRLLVRGEATLALYQRADPDKALVRTLQRPSADPG